jgi:CheY-like chemotaxis protein
MTTRVLLLGEVGGVVEALLRDRSFEVTATSSLEEAAAILRGTWFDLMVLDLDVIGHGETEILEEISAGLGTIPPRVLLSRKGGQGTVARDDRVAILESIAATLPAPPKSPSDQIKSLRGLIRGASGVSRVRVVLCATPTRLGAVSRAALRISSFRPPPEEAPVVPVPYTIAIMPLGEDLDLEIVGLPLVPAYAPLWPLVLSGAQCIVRLDAGAARLLDEACAQLDRRHVDGEDLVAGFVEDDEERVAELVRAAVERGDYA